MLVRRRSRILRTMRSTCVSYALRLVVLAVVVYFCAPPIVDFARVWLRARAVRNSPQVAEIATACIQLLQTTHEYRRIDGNQTDSIPPILRSMRPQDISIDPTPPQRVSIEFGGGFFHFGYKLEALAPPAHGWSFSYYGENEEDVIQLLTLPQ